MLAKMCRTLGEHEINIRGISISDTVDHAVVRLVVTDPRKAIHVLGEHGMLVVETEVLALDLPDSPGKLAEAAGRLARAKVNIEYAYGSSDTTHGMVFVRVSDIKKAVEVLTPKAKKK